MRSFLIRQKANRCQSTPCKSRNVIISTIEPNIHIENEPIKAPKDKHGRFSTLLLFLILFLCEAATLLIKANALHDKELQAGIAAEIIRFHVIANSDSTNDQKLKLTVRDKLIEQLSPFLRDADSIADARRVLTEKMSYIEEIAEATVKENGYSYPVTVTLGESYFPLKIYGDYTFPPGYYEALRVQIGAAKGKNWWCVMFPPLCFVDETYSIVDEESGEKLETLLTEEEYETLTSNKTPVKIRFKLLEVIKSLFDQKE